MPTDRILQAYDALVTHLGPLARYRLDETSGTTARDGADGLDGTYRNDVALGQGGIVGSNAAAGFGGADDFVEVGTASGNSGSAKIVAFGDSLVAGFGLSQGQAFPAQLEAALGAAGFDAEVVNAGCPARRRRRQRAGSGACWRSIPTPTR